MVAEKFKEEKQKAKREVEKATAVSLTSDMWTSIHMDAYLAVTCHFVNEQDTLSTVLLGVGHFSKAHTAENIAEVKKVLMEEWGIQNKVRCLVTDAAPNMISSSKILKVRHTKCIAHTLNLIVRKSIDNTPGLEEIRGKARKMVSYFRSSATAKEKLCQMQQQMGRSHLKLLQEVDTRWNSTYTMLQRLYEEREPVSAALVSMRTDLAPVTAEEYHSVKECLEVLSPFYTATTELSGEQRVSGSKVIPLVCMLRYAIAKKQPQVLDDKARQLCMNLTRMLGECSSHLETMSVMTIATLLDPRFKAVGFCSQTNAQAAVRRLTAECATIIENEKDQIMPVPPIPSTSSQPEPATSSATQSGGGLWDLLDSHMVERQVRNATADATVEVQRYMADPLIPRTEDPLHFWATRKNVYPHLHKLALQFLCTPASSVPCERIFSKA
uniref:HAT C-terminal dimerisation domain-containing protein n=1 Tax=Oreochromis niloticus TaxID=8128 RepID=A0A669B7A9_ORENI